MALQAIVNSASLLCCFMFLYCSALLACRGDGIELGFYFLDDVVEPQYILLCRFHFTDCGILAAFVLGLHRRHLQ